MTFAPPLSCSDQDETPELRPKFDANGLIAAIAQDADTGEILMLAWMNAEALTATIETKRATYWSRSRDKLWIKGETSGHFQDDQDAIVMKVRQTDAACHTGRKSCFYRRVEDGTRLSFSTDL